MAKKEERFEVTFRDGSQLKDEGVRQILVDKETGVNYLCWKSGYVRVWALLNCCGAAGHFGNEGSVLSTANVDFFQSHGF